MNYQNRIIGHGEKPAREFVFNSYNWRKHPKNQQAALHGVLTEVGWVQDVIVNTRTGNLIDGHVRIELALKQGDTSPVPYVEVDLSEDEERLILASLDPLSAMATADTEQLDALLREVSTDDAAVQAMLADLAKNAGLNYGVEPSDIDAEPQIDKAEELRVKWQTSLGQLWQLGDHRLVCGDCTDPAIVARVMGDEKFGLLFTSPPYAQQRDYDQLLQQWDSLMQGAFKSLPMLMDAQILVNLGLIYRNNSVYVYWDKWLQFMVAEGYRFFGWYIWDQGSGLPGDWNGRLSPSFEFVFHFNRQSVKPKHWVEKKPENIKVKHTRCLRNKNGTIPTVNSPIAGLNNYKIPDAVIRVNRNIASNASNLTTLHPATFSVGLAEYIIRSWPGIVYEPFSGAGTTIIACERLGRKCRAIEVSPRYCAVTLERFFSTTNKRPELISGA